MQVGGTQLEGAVAIEDFVDVREFREIVIHAFDHHHRLFAVVDGQRLVFHRLGDYVDFGQLPDLRMGSSAGAVFPVVGSTCSCGSKLVNSVATRSWNPLNTDSVTTNAIVATATPTTEMPEIRLMTFVDFFENR